MDGELDVVVRHDRVRHGHRQGRRALGLPRRGLRVARRLLPGGRPRRPRRRARRDRALLPLRGRRAAALLRRPGTSRSTRSRRCSTPSRAHDGPVEPAELQEATDLSQTKLASALSRLEDAGAVRGAAGRRGGARPTDAPPPARRSARPPRPRRCAAAFDRSRVDMMRAYAETDDCRRAFVLSYFGEPFEPPCGNCDNCRGRARERRAAGRRAVRGRRAGRARPVGRGRRPALRRRRDGRAVRRGGYKTLALEVVRERALLEAVCGASFACLPDAGGRGRHTRAGLAMIG